MTEYQCTATIGGVTHTLLTCGCAILSHAEMQLREYVAIFGHDIESATLVRYQRVSVDD